MIDVIDKETLERLVNEGWTLTRIAEEYLCSVAYLSLKCKEWGIKVKQGRPRGRTHDVKSRLKISKAMRRKHEEH